MNRKPESTNERRMQFRERLCDAAIEYAPDDQACLAILLVLARRYANWHTGDKCWPSDETLAKKARCSAKTVQRKRKILEKAGWMDTWYHPTKGVCYILKIPRVGNNPGEVGENLSSPQDERTQSPGVDTESSEGWTQSPPNSNQENSNQEKVKCSGGGDPILGGEIDDGENPPPADDDVHLISDSKFSPTSDQLDDVDWDTFHKNTRAVVEAVHEADESIALKNANKVAKGCALLGMTDAVSLKAYVFVKLIRFRDKLHWPKNRWVDGLIDRKGIVAHMDTFTSNHAHTSHIAGGTETDSFYAPNAKYRGSEGATKSRAMLDVVRELQAKRDAELADAELNVGGEA